MVRGPVRAAIVQVHEIFHPIGVAWRESRDIEPGECHPVRDLNPPSNDGSPPMRQAMKYVLVLALAIGSVAAGVGAAEATPGHSIAGGLGCCRAFQ
jgi:hypothetical protein